MIPKSCRLSDKIMHQQPSKREPGVVSDDRGKSAQKARQAQRLRAALRENLKRRKAQTKGRAGAGAASRMSHDSAGIAEDKKEGSQ
jgi:hypothetical protein